MRHCLMRVGVVGLYSVDLDLLLIDRTEIRKYSCVRMLSLSVSALHAPAHLAFVTVNARVALLCGTATILGGCFEIISIRIGCSSGTAGQLTHLLMLELLPRALSSVYVIPLIKFVQVFLFFQQVITSQTAPSVEHLMVDSSGILLSRTYMILATSVTT